MYLLGCGGDSMSIGTAIFLTGLLACVVGLYAATKDRWGWRRIVRRTSIAIGAIVGLVILASAGIWSWENIEWPIGRQTAYSRIKLGATPDEVNYIKGQPDVVYGPLEAGDFPGKPIIEVSKIQKGKTFRDYSDWVWREDKSRIDVSFDSNRAGVIAVGCFSSDRLSRCPDIGGITDGSREDQVIKRFGKPESEQISGVTKTLNYEKVGVWFFLEREVVYMLGIHSPSYKP